MTNTEDLRYVRTERAIRSAFMELVTESPVSSVSASDICRHAGISRNAFYLHHANVTELYATLVGELVEDIRAESLASFERRAETGRDDELYVRFISALARHEDVLRALLPSDDGSLAKCLAEGIEESFVEAALQFGEHGGSFEHRLRCSYSAWALVGLVVRWVAGTDRPLDRSVEIFTELHGGAVDASARFLMAPRGAAR